MTSKNNCVTLTEIGLSKPQVAFLEYCKEFGWGKLEVTVKDGIPVMITPIKQDIKLD